ncbi:hypothetical protein ACOMHN_035849 [Nucella lapillus]
MKVRVEMVTNLPVPAYWNGPCGDHVTVFPDGGTFCGRRSGRIYVNIPENELYVRFRSDGRPSFNSGFNLTFTLLKGSCHPTVRIPGSGGPSLMPIVDILTRRSLVLSLRACSAVSIVLTSHINDLYRAFRKVVLFPQTVQWNCNMAYCQASRRISPRILDCGQFREAWVQWEDYKLRVGRGRVVGQGSILTVAYNDRPPVRGVYLGAGGYSYLVKFDANFPDFFCKTPTGDLTQPPSLSPQATTVTDSVTVSATSSPLPTGPADITSTDYDVTTSDLSSHLATGPADVKSTDNDVTADFSTSADYVMTSTDDKVTGKDVTTTEDDVNTTGDVDDVTPTDSDVFSSTAVEAAATADGIASTVDDATTTVSDVTSSADDIITTTTTGDEITQISSQPINISTLPPPPPPPLPIKVIYSREQRSCRCIKQSPKSKTATHQAQTERAQEEEEKKGKLLVEAMTKNLKMEARNTSTHVRRHISAADERTSSMVIGVVSGIVCCLPLVLILVSDLKSMLRELKIWQRRICFRGDEE